MNAPIIESTRYSATAIALHWLMAIAIIGLFVLGIFMSNLPLSPQKLKLYSWHKWTGVTLFALTWIRLIWRLTHRPPALPETMSRSVHLAAHFGHGILYLLMFAVPLSGWLMSSAKGFQTVLFGILPIPDLLQKNKELGDLLQTAHWGLNILFALIVIGHIAAALKHHFINRDDILIRMSPHHRKPSTLL